MWDEDNLANKVAIVTGTNTEIGAAVSEALGQAGASVLLSYYGDVGCAGEVAGRLRAAGGQAELHPADLSRVQDNQQLVGRALELWGRLDVFVANAGLTINAPFLETTEAQWDTVANLNKSVAPRLGVVQNGVFDTKTAQVPVTTAFIEIAVGDARPGKRHASSSLKPLLLLLRQIAMPWVVLRKPCGEKALWQICPTDRRFSSL